MYAASKKRKGDIITDRRWSPEGVGSQLLSNVGLPNIYARRVTSISRANSKPPAMAKSKVKRV